MLLTDADIFHPPDNLRRLVARAEAGNKDLVSQMVRLAIDTPAEAYLIPAFVYFFAMLYPFAWVRQRDRASAAAAGGAMLVRREALAAIGGLAMIKDRIIDDCSLAQAIKALPAPRGGLDLRLSDAAISLRGYGGFDGVGRMVARSAYTQLGYQPLALVASMLGLILAFVAPLLLALHGGITGLLGLVAYGLMVLTFAPMLNHYHQSPLRALALPLIALAYLGFTVTSALDHHRGQGARWKGRIGARGPSS